jgi:hypothetical protein
MELKESQIRNKNLRIYLKLSKKVNQNKLRRKKALKNKRNQFL